MRAGKPQHIKLNNEALVRRVLLERGEATTSELVEETGLSQTTVGQILEAMSRARIVGRTGKRASDIGRPAIAWEVAPEAWTSIAIAAETEELSWALADARGAIGESGSLPSGGDPVRGALSLARELAAKAAGAKAAGDGRGRSALALGLPGAVKDGRLITGDLAVAWAEVDLRELFERELGIPVVVENDLNAVALGYAASARAEAEAPESLAYVHFNGGACIGSGLVIGGRILRGASSYSGELGFLPMGEGRILDDLIVAVEGDDERYAEAIVRAVATVNCVVNPALVVLGGRGFRFELEGEIRRRLEAEVDERVRPRLAFAPRSLPYYLAGLAGLASERVFPDVRLTES
jgi:predicted NBD/HSP70 family sugar kinase